MAATDLLRSVVPWGGRRQRQAVLRGRLAHVEVRGLEGPQGGAVRSLVERALTAEPWVTHARVIDPLGRVVVALDDTAELGQVVRCIAAVERQLGVDHDRFRLDRPEHPADAGPILREAVAAAVDVVATGAAIAGRLARVPPLPAEVGAMASILQGQPKVRHAAATVVGPAVTDTALAVVNAGVQALAQGPAGLVADLGHRLSLLGEHRARRAAWDRAQDDLLAPERPVHDADAGDHAGRPTALRHGPVETYSERARMASLGAAGATMLATGDLRRSGAAAMAMLPKAVGLGRDTFAAHLGRTFADRDILCLDPAALRRLDRIDTVVLDPSVLTTGELGIDRIDVVGDSTTAEARRWARELFEPECPRRRARRGGWGLGPLTARERREIGAEVPDEHHVLVLRHGGFVVAFVTLAECLDPMARTLIGAARSADHLVIVPGREDLADRVGAEYLDLGAEDLLGHVRALQEDGCGVALVAGSAASALAAADLGIGVVGSAVPWAADILVPDLSAALLVLDAAAVAADVSRQSAALALAGSAVGGVLALTSTPVRAAARAVGSVNGAALAALANGARAAAAFAARPPARVDEHPPWHELEPDEVLLHVDSSEAGLSEEEAAERSRRSAVVEDGPISFGAAVLEELANPLTPVLAGAAALSTAVGSLVDAAIVGGVVGVNALVGGAQRYQVERTVRRLEIASSHRVRTERGGRTVGIAVAELVPGDVVTLSAGESVPADCRILSAVALEVDESSLTGESMPVPKTAAAAVSSVIAERRSMLYDSTVIAAGEVRAVIVATGADTEARQDVTSRPTPSDGVEARLRDLTRVTIPLAGFAGAGITVMGLLRGRPIAQSLHSGVTLAVAAVPEGLPILATMAQLSAARRLSARGALVRNPKAIEALGRVDLLCCDKTGTLTEGRIELHRVSDGRSALELGPEGPAAAILAAALRASPLFNIGDDPLPHLTDRAVVDGAVRHGVGPTLGAPGWRRGVELPFEPARGYHAALGRLGDTYLLSVKGAPEVVLPRCSSWLANGDTEELDDRERARLSGRIDALARTGHRILAVAEREASSRADLDDERVDRLCLRGLLMLSDPVRPAAAQSVAALSAAGVRTVMITGDHPSTAEGIAAELGLLNGHRVVTGPEVDALDDTGLDAILDEVSVFARVTPTHKVRLVAAYQRQGRAVAMTGDGANDAPAIRLADVGVALGENSTSAARAVADVVVVDGRIETLIDAIVEGRGMWASVREAIAILVGGNLGEILFTVGTSAVSQGALSPRQLLLVNLLTDAAPSLAIAMRTPRDKRPEDLLREGPEASLGISLERQVVSRAVATAAGAGLAWGAARLTGRAQRASTVGLVGLVGTQLGQTLVVGGGDPVVVAAALGSAAILAGIIQTPGLSQFFGCTPLGPVGWAQGLAGSAAGVGLSLVLPPVVARIPRFAEAQPAPGDTLGTIGSTGPAGQIHTLRA